MSWYRVHMGTTVPMEIANNPQNMERSYFIQASSIESAISQGMRAFTSVVKTQPTFINISLATEEVILNVPISEKKIEIVAPPRMTEKNSSAR